MKIFRCVAILLLSMSANMIWAQTSTPAPTKTPVVTSTPMSSAPVLAQTPVLEVPLLRAYTQEDLSVLVGNVQRPNGFVWFNNYLYTACNGDFTLYEVDATSGQTTTFVYGVRNAYTLFAEETAQGFNLWIPDFDTDRILLVDQRRRQPRDMANGLSAPWGIAYLDEQSFLVTNFRGNNIVRVSRDGEIAPVLDGLRSPAGIVVHDNLVYYVNNGSTRRALEWFSLDEETPQAKPLLSGLESTTNLVMGSDNYLYFAYALGTRGVVGRINPQECLEGGCSNEQVEIVVYTDLQAPLAGLTLSPEMKLYVHTIYRPEIYTVELIPTTP